MQHREEHAPRDSYREPFRPQQVRQVRCYNCNGMGHFSAECRQPRRERDTARRYGGNGKAEDERRVLPQGQVNFVNRSAEEKDDFHPKVQLTVGDKDEATIEVRALIDTGSPISFVKQSQVPRRLVTKNVEKSRFFGINDSALKIIGDIKAKIKFQRRELDTPLRVVADETMQSALVLGRDFIKLAKLAFIVDEEIAEIMNIEVESDIRKSVSRPTINSALQYDVKENFYRLFEEEYVNPTRPEQPQTENLLKLRLSDSKPFHFAPRRLSFTEKDKLRGILDDLLAKGAIRESTSEYASPIVLAKKKNGETRMCIDFRVLNKVTVRDNFPLPLIEDQLDLLQGKKYFSSLDLRDGFFHIRMHEDSIKYTSFVTPFEQYECTKMPFGLKGGPLRFQRYVAGIFKNLISRGDVSVYLDDFLIASVTIEHHLEVLQEVFKLCVANKLELRMDKCKFLETEIEYLGYRVTSDGIRPTERGIDNVQKFPVPRNTREVQSFLGLSSYFRKFIENFSIIAKPLYDLTKEKSQFKFGPEEKEAFDALKNCLIQAPILGIYCPRDETELHCDASAIGFGAILLQKKADQKFHPIFYFSKRTTDTESKYHSFELETLAIIYALRRFRPYLCGVPFKIVTDCQALSLTLNKKETNPRIARWTLELQDYDYTLEHRAGTRMRHVDALSRQVLVLQDNSLDRNLALCQQQDEQIQKIRQKLETSEDKFFEMINGLIYRKIDDRALFFVPATLENSIMHQYHNELGHVGSEKTITNIMNSYWFPNIKEKVTKYIKNCLKCIAFSPKSGRQEGMLHEIPKENKPFLTLHIDHLGPMSKKQSLKYRYIFLIIDGFTKYTKIYPTKSTGTAEVIKYLKQHFATYSRPLRIVSDRGSCFTAHDFEQFLENHDVQHIKIATAMPQANGQAERMNRTIIPMISKLVDERNAHWYEVLEEVEFAINNSVNKSTGETPSVLLYGVPQRGKAIDAVRNILESSGALRTERNLSETREKAALRIRRSFDANKKLYDKRHKPAIEYKVGDKIMIANFVNSSDCTKLVPKYKGPYEVARVLRNDRYIIKDVEGFQVTQVPYQGTWAACHMRPWLSN